MKAVVPLLVVAALALSAGAAATRPAPGATNLTITVWPNGLDGPSATRTLRCAPAGGTLPNPAEACLQLSRMARPFAPVDTDAPCLMRVYGPQRALVRGNIGERRIWARLHRTDSCQELRWQRHAWLFRRVR